MASTSSWRCPRCATLNLATAESCRRCGARPSDAAARARPRATADHAGLAAVLSVLLPGLGQLYTRRIRRALLIVAIPIAFFVILGGVLAVVDPLLELVLRVAAGVAAALTVVLGVCHGGVVVDAFAAPSTRGRGISGKRGGEYLALVACLVFLALFYVVLFRQATAWAVLAQRVFEPFQRSGGSAAQQAWSGSDRLNVLLLGIDTRQGGAENSSQNTDTMLVLTVDPANHAAGMLSVPRDTLVAIPGHGDDKINAAYAAGGPELAVKTVSNLLKIPIQSYALVDFVGFRKIIEAVGGVIVDAPIPVRDEAYPTEDYGITRLDIRAGPQLMDGETALRYSRSRHDTNDFSRAERQQRVITALRHRVSERQTLLQLPTLVGELSDAVQTDLDPANALPLARLGLSVDTKAIERRVLMPSVAGEPGQLRELNSPSGYYLVPIQSAIDELVAQLFYDVKVRQEAASIEIRATAGKTGTADDVRDALQARRYTIARVTAGASASRTTVLLRTSAKRYTAEQLAKTLGASVTEGPADTDADIVVTLGDDFRGLVTGR